MEYHIVKYAIKKKNHTEKAKKCTQCSHLIHKKCAKKQNRINNNEDFICALCTSENFPFIEITYDKLLENTYNSNFFCKCLKNQNLFNTRKTNTEQFNLIKTMQKMTLKNKSLKLLILIFILLMNFIN